VLSHEISHVARHDALTQLLSLLHRAVFWFSPLGWWLHRQLTDLAEQASDEAALAGGADRTLYAETLLGFFARLESMPGRVRWQVLSMANGDGPASAERRVDRILSWKGVTAMKKRLVIALIALAAPIIFLAASLHPLVSYAQAEAGTPSTPPQAAVAPSGTKAHSVPSSPQLQAAREALADAQEDARTANTSSVLSTRQERAAQGAVTKAQSVAHADEHSDRRTNGINIVGGSFNIGSGPRYVMMKANSSEVTMSGDEEDLQHARRLREKIKSDFIWFQHDEKSYVITDPAFLARVSALFAPGEELSRQQDELGRQQDELGRQQDAMGGQMEKIKVKAPDIRPELEQIRMQLKELQSSGATQRELGRVQSRIGELQRQIGRLESDAGRQQAVIGRQQGELGRKQGELGRQQGELGRRQGQLARQASRELRGMFDDAITRGIAKPE
ncbi:MAG: M56 family metallopeptidase, partial [Actinomycetota bacterium]